MRTPSRETGHSAPVPALALNASLPRPLVCAQRVGDVVFVPAGWGHAVLNTREVAGLAVEFVYRYNRLV